MTDNTTSEGWLKKTNFIKDGEEPIQVTIQLEVARHHTTNYLLIGIQEYSQWFRGADNNVADALSRDNDRSNNELTNILRTHCYSQLPQHFKITPLPNKITSWLTAALAAHQTAVGGGTLKNKAWAWKWYTEYCNRVGLGHNPFLDGMSRQHKIKIIGTFGVALCQGQILRAADSPLAHSTVGDTLNLVAATFRNNQRDDPKRDTENDVA